MPWFVAYLRGIETHVLDVGGVHVMPWFVAYLRGIETFYLALSLRIAEPGL